jgi:hypothetical protein
VANLATLLYLNRLPPDEQAVGWLYLLLANGLVVLVLLFVRRWAALGWLVASVAGMLSPWGCFPVFAR